MKKRCVIIGGGGHAKVVIEAIRSGKSWEPAAVTDNTPGRKAVLGVPVVGTDRILPKILRRGIRYFIVGVGGVPDTATRIRLYRFALESGLTPMTVIHATAVVAAGARIGEGTVVMALAVVNVDGIVEESVIVNTGALVEHEVRIRAHAHIGPGACLSGGVGIGSGAFVGAGAIVREGVRIGAKAVVGAGAVVLRDVPAELTVVGVPARPCQGRG
jgi:UDP-perosamine 4-acetyltransferase